MKFQLVISYEEGMDDLQIMLNTESEDEDQKLGVAVAHTLYNLNSGGLLEHLKQAVTAHATRTGDTSIAHAIFNEWQRMTLHNDNKPEVSPSQAARINHAF